MRVIYMSEAGAMTYPETTLAPGAEAERKFDSRFILSGYRAAPCAHENPGFYIAKKKASGTSMFQRLSVDRNPP
jgi:hypothetical protein